MRNLLVLLIISGFILTSCNNENSPTVTFGAKCMSSDECILPSEFASQSNCPFEAACVKEKCAVVCPIFYSDPDPQIKKIYEFRCTVDKGCDCSYRGNKTIACGCVDGICSSVEAWQE